MDINEKIKEITPKWANYKDVIYEKDYNGKPVIIITLSNNDSKGIESLNGIDILKFMNNADIEIYDFIDESYGYEYTYDSEFWKDDEYVLFFAIKYGHYIPDNSITIKKNGDVEISLEEPFDGCGACSELVTLVKVYLETINFYN